MTEVPGDRFSVAMFLWLAPAGEAALAGFRQSATTLFARHGLKVERVLKLTSKGQIVGENRHDMPDLFQLVSFESAKAFQAYIADPEYVALAAERDKGIRRMVVLAGTAVDLGALATSGSGTAETRLYGVGLARFREGGAAGMQAFNERAQPLFARHGMHLEANVDIAKALAPIGPLDGFTADRVVIFFLDAASQLQAYASDPEYAALAPLRDDGLAGYDLFFGMVPARPTTSAEAAE